MKMVETPNQAIINMCPQLDNRMQFALNETNRIKYYFIAEIFEGKKCVNYSVNILQHFIMLKKLYLLYLQQVLVFLLLHLLLLLLHQLEESKE